MVQKNVIFIYLIKTDKNTSFSPVYNNKKILTEKSYKTNFYAKCINILESIKHQTPRTFKNSYFIFFPDNENYLSEILKFNNSEEYVLINIEHLPKHKNLKENFKKFIKEINGKEIFEDIDLLISDFSLVNSRVNDLNCTFYNRHILKK